MERVVIVQFGVVPGAHFGEVVAQVKETFPYRVWPPLGDNFVGEDSASGTVRVAVWDDLLSEQCSWIESHSQVLSLRSRQFYARCCQKWTDTFCAFCKLPACFDHRLEREKEVVCFRCRGYQDGAFL